jgi:chitin synthase
MKVVVAIDLIATMILPASYCYAMYLIFLVFFQDLPVSTVLLILYAIIMGVQVVVFILRSRWDYIWWFFIYFTVGLPVFYLILPVYSFWNMDDFSWGKTRAVGGNVAANAAAVEEEEDDDDEKEMLYNGRGGDRDDDTYDSRRSRGSRNSRGSNGSGDRSYDSRSYNGRSYRSRDQGSVGSGSRASRDSRRSSGSGSRRNY